MSDHNPGRFNSIPGRVGGHYCDVNISRYDLEPPNVEIVIDFVDTDNYYEPSSNIGFDAQTARKLAARLIQLADELEGKNATE